MNRTKYTKNEFDTAANGICPGPDLEWFAIDREGHVAGFTSAGFAIVPEAVFHSFDLFNEALDAISQLPHNGVANWVYDKPPRPDTWESWAQRGLFAYDWCHTIGQPEPLLPYLQMCYPEHPLHASQLPKTIVDYLMRAHLTNVSFRHARELFVQ